MIADNEERAGGFHIRLQFLRSFCGGCTRNGRRPLGLELAQAGLRKLLHMKCHKCHLQINTFNSVCCLNIARAWSDKWSRAGAAVQVPRKTSRARALPRAIVLTPAVSAPSPAPGLGHRDIDARPQGCHTPASDSVAIFSTMHMESPNGQTGAGDAPGKSSKGHLLRYKKERPRL